MQNIIRGLIASIDFEIKKQLTLILEHKEFKKINSDWSSLYYIAKLAQHNPIKIKILNIKWDEIASSFDNQEDILNCIIARKISDEFEIPGNAPLSIIIGNYKLDVSNDSTVKTLSHIAEVCSSVFAPFITTITPEIFGISDLVHLAKIDLKIHYNAIRFSHLKKFANQEIANFVGLVIPEILFPSLLNTDKNKKKYCPILGIDIKNFEEILGNAAYAFVGVVIESFIDTGWFLDIIGMPSNDYSQANGLGSVPEIRAQKFFNDTNISFGIFKYITECLISETKEEELRKLGFISLCQIKNRDFAVFYNANSVKTLADSNKEFMLPNSLQYILCISRFAHYIKIISREKIGLYSNISELQYYLNNWLYQYISSDLETSLYLKHKYPLSGAKVELFSKDKFNENIQCLISLSPHLKSAQIASDIILKTYINKSTVKN